MRKANCGTERGQPKRVASYAVPMVRIHLPPAAVTCDNTEKDREAYADYFAFIHDPAQRFRTMTLPFSGGLETSVRAI